MRSKKVVVLLSGGMDSAVCAAIAAGRGYEISALHLDYGQRTREKELDCFHKIADYFGAKEKLVVSVEHFSKIGASSLTDESIEVSKAKLDSEEIPTSYVPFRNANLLAIAVSRAEVVGAEAIFIGAIEQDSSGYPDCRRSFFDAFEEAANLGTRPETGIKIITPLIDMCKKEIVLEGSRLGVPFEHTWSCYKSIGPACGECDSCALRLRGFARAGIDDPLLYAVRPKYE